MSICHSKRFGQCDNNAVGRTHRSNQVSAPEYVFLISELAGEQRFASTVAKRLESLVIYQQCDSSDLM